MNRDTTVAKLYKVFEKSKGISIDSRTTQEGEIFFALKGEHSDGNRYAHQAIEKGALVAVIDDCRYQSENTFCVEDVLTTLQRLARYHIELLDTKVLAITGTNGKTTTKELVKEVLSSRYKVFATEGNFNNHIGLPLMVLKITPEIELAVLEMGASKPGDIKELCNIADPDFGLITNIGKAHLEFFGSQENLIKTKMELYDAVDAKSGVLFFNCANRATIPIEKYKNARIVSYGLNLKDCTYTATPFLYQDIFAGIRIGDQIIDSHLVGGYNAENMLAAFAVGKFFGVPEPDIKEKIMSYFPSNKRSQFIRSRTNKIILDAYNANPTSMQNAIDAFLIYRTDLRKVLILGDMLELGAEADHEHKMLLEKLAKEDVTLLLVGKHFGKYRADFPSLLFFEHTDELKKYLTNNKITDSFVLIKGSRGIALEKILDTL